MPQLDNLIILPQVFWLIIFFGTFYFVLTYYYLPFFLKTINVRKYFLENNKITNNLLTSDILNKKKLILIELNSNFDKIKLVLFLKLFSIKFKFKKKPFISQFAKLNKKLLNALNNSILYCNSYTLNNFKFYPKLLNKKK